MEALSRLPVDNVVFPKLGIDLTINSEAISIFGFSVKWYGVMIALGMLLAMMYCFRRAKEYGIDGDRLIDAVIAGVIGAVVGARLYYVVLHSASYHSIKDILSIRDGGLAIYGGIIGGLLFGCIMAKIRKLKIMPTLDIVAMGLFIGQCLGRWGNFFNQEAFGSKTTLPWGMTSQRIINELYAFYYPENVSIVTNRATEMIAHPCFLYESLWCLVGFVALHFYKKHRKFDGELFLLYIGWYGLGRFWIEGLRTDSLYLIYTDALQLKVSQIVAGACVIFALVLLIYMYMSVRRNGYTFYCDTDESKELLRIYDEKLLASKRKSGKHADDALDTHILAPDAEDKAEPSEAAGEASAEKASAEEEQADGQGENTEN